MYLYSDGFGQSCTFIAIWSLIEQLKTEGQIDVLNTVKSIRTQRPGAIPELVNRCNVNYCKTVLSVC